jgi:hypothetical protein
MYHTVACIIVCRLLISVHKWQSSGMADTHEYWSQHDAHIVYLPIFHGLNLMIFLASYKGEGVRNDILGLECKFKSGLLHCEMQLRIVGRF